jgi:Thiamine pyrophosphate enzyme, N-terminal TPP binding domain
MATGSGASLPNTPVHSTAHHLIQALDDVGIEYLFCNFGTDHAPLIEELARFAARGLHAPKVVLCPHENVAMHMAGGYAQMTGKGQAVHFVTKRNFDFRKLPQSVEQNAGGLELLALHDEGMLRILRQNGMVEFGNEPVRRAIPELEDWRHQADPYHFLCQSMFRKQVQRRWMRRRRARVRLKAVVVIEQPHGHAAPAEYQRAQQSDRAAARDQHATIFN